MGLAGRSCVTCLSSVLDDALPVLIGCTGLLLQAVQIRQFPAVAERQNEQVIELACLRCRLLLDDPRTGPRCLTDVVGVLLLVRAADASSG